MNFSIVIVAASLIAQGMVAHASVELPNRYLYNLGEGSTLKTLSPIRIPANSSRTRVTPQDSKVVCWIRAVSTPKRDILIPAGRTFTVRAVWRNSMTHRRSIYGWTHLRLDSDRIGELVCTREAQDDPDPSLREFQAAVRGVFALEIVEPDVLE
jgi:hypothetical protein